MGSDFFGGSGIWIIFPIIMIPIMLTFMYMMFGRRGQGMPWQDSGRNHSENRESETALDILTRRYARGEVTKEEFEEMKENLLSV